MEKYDETTDILANMAKVKMEMNAHKGGIEDIPEDDLVHMMKDEITELVDAIESEDITHIIEECADVLNFLTAIAHQQITRYRSRK